MSSLVLQKVNQAVSNYLEHKGASVLDTIILEDAKLPDNHAVIVFEGEESIHFAEVAYTIDAEDFNDKHMTRQQFEKIMLEWLKHHRPVEDSPIVFDQIDVNVIASDNAAIRHHIKAF